MNPHDPSVFTTGSDPQGSEINLQERDCAPIQDTSLTAEDVLADRLLDDHASPAGPIFVP